MDYFLKNMQSLVDVTVFFHNYMFMRFNLEIHGIFRLLFCFFRLSLLEDCAYEDDAFGRTEEEGPQAPFKEDEAF